MSVRDRQFFDRYQTIASQLNAVARSLVTYLLVERNLLHLPSSAAPTVGLSSAIKSSKITTPFKKMAPGLN